MAELAAAKTRYSPQPATLAMLTLVKRATLILVIGLAGPSADPALARPGGIACSFDRGVLIAAAEVMGVAGDFIIDTGQAKTLLAETQAQEAGFEATALTGDVRLAGVSWLKRPVMVADLDARTVFLTTPIAGVIGIDLLRDRVVDISIRPCRLTLHAAGAAPRFPAGRRAEIGWQGGVPVVQAAVGDGVNNWMADFTPATGLDLSLRLDDRLASAPGATKPHELYPGGVWRAPLATLSFAGDIYREVDTGLTKGPESGPSPAGMIGGRVLSHYRLRFDFPAGRLYIAAPR